MFTFIQERDLKIENLKQVQQSMNAAGGRAAAQAAVNLDDGGSEDDEDSDEDEDFKESEDESEDDDDSSDNDESGGDDDDDSDDDDSDSDSDSDSDEKLKKKKAKKEGSPRRPENFRPALLCKSKISPSSTPTVDPPGSSPVHLLRPSQFQRIRIASPPPFSVFVLAGRLSTSPPCLFLG